MERCLVVAFPTGTTVGVANTSCSDGKYSGTTESGESWPMVELRPLNWKRGKLHIKELEEVKIKRR